MDSATNFYKPVLSVASNVKTSKTGTPAFRELTDCAGGQDRRKMGRKRQENRVLDQGRIQEEERQGTRGSQAKMVRFGRQSSLPEV